MPFESYPSCLADVLSLLCKRDYFSIVEVRFTPEKSQAQQRGEIFAITEDILRSYGGQPQLGKKTNMSAQDMLETYGDRFRQFQEVRGRQDPDGKFLNAFCRQLFGAV